MMFGKKKDQDVSTQTSTESSSSSTTTPAADSSGRSFLRPEATTTPTSRPAVSPDLGRRPPDLSAYTQRRDATSTTSGSGSTASRPAESDQRKLIVGRDIFLNGEIRSCDTLVVEGRVEAVLVDCRAVEIAPAGQMKGAADIEAADISGRFDGELTVQGRLIVRATGKVLGKIKYRELEVERGGTISGTIESLPEVASSATGGQAA